MSITLADIREAKEVAERAIGQAVINFTKTAGVAVKGISYLHYQCDSVGGEVTSGITNIKLELTL